MELDLSAPYSDLSEPTTPSGNLVGSESTTSGFPEARTDHQAGSTENGTAKKQKSCAPCRIRRVKCERKPGQQDCIKCGEKGLNCSAMPDRKRVNRSGKRIEQARGAFGSAQQAQAQAHTPDPQQGDDRLEIIAGSTWLEIYLAQDNGVGRLLVTDTALAFDFHRANRRVHELKPSAQVLCAVIMAIGARCSDHPALIGAGAPRIAELGTAARAGVDLRPFGRRREDACATLFERALSLADQHGTMRDPSLESLASLVLIEGLVETTDVSHSAARPFVAAYTSHTKILLEERAISSDQASRVKPGIANTVLGWTSFLRDALTAANQGRAPAFSEDDKYLLTCEGKEVPLPLRLLLQTTEPTLDPTVDVAEHFWSLFQSVMHTIANLAREVPGHLTGPRARASERIDEAFANYFLDEATFLFDALPELKRREALAKAAMPELYLQADIATLVRTIMFSSCTLSWLLNRVVGQRLAGRHPEVTSSLAVKDLGGGALLNSRREVINPWPAMPGPSNDDEYWRRLFLLRRRVYTQAFRASRRVAFIIGETIEQGYSLSSAWLDPRFVQVLFSRLGFWVSTIVNMPTVEQGGPHPDFTFMDKLQDLEWVRKGCFSVGWMSVSMSGSADWVKEEILKTEEAQREHWRRMGGAPTSEPAATTAVQVFLNSLTAEQMAQAGVLPAQAPQSGPGLTSSLPQGHLTSWPPSSTSTSSMSTSNPASPPSVQAGSPAPVADPTNFNMSAPNTQIPAEFSEAEVQALLEQYAIPPPTSAAAPLLGMPAHAPASSPLAASGHHAGGPSTAPGLWGQFFAYGPAAPPMASTAGRPVPGSPAFAPGASSHDSSFQPEPMSKSPLQGNLVGGVDWNDLLGTEGGFEGAWAMLGGEGNPFAGFVGDPAFGSGGGAAGQGY